MPVCRPTAKGLNVRESPLTLAYCISKSPSCAETGNMLIMTYAHARASGDGSLISKYVCRGYWPFLRELTEAWQYSVLTSWADYLINTSLLNDEQWAIFEMDYLALMIANLTGLMQTENAWPSPLWLTIVTKRTLPLRASSLLEQCQKWACLQRGILMLMVILSVSICLTLYSKIDRVIEKRHGSLPQMEDCWLRQWPTSPRTLWRKHFVDIRL